MENYFQISDKTRILEQQYADVLARKLRMETELVEEDYSDLLAAYEDLVARAACDENKHRRRIDELGAVVDQLGREKTEGSDALVQMKREMEQLSRTREDEEKQSQKVLESLRSVRMDEDGTKISEICAVVRSVEKSLNSILNRPQEECDRHKSDLEKVRAEIAALREAREPGIEESLVNTLRKEIEWLGSLVESNMGRDELKQLREANARLLQENAVLGDAERRMKEKDEIIDALKERMKQKSDVIEAQKRQLEMREKHVVSKENVLNVFDDVLKAEESGNDLVECDEKIKDFWADVPIKPKSAKPVVPKKAAKNPRVRKPVNRANPKLVKPAKETPAEPKRLFVPGHLLKPENSSYFADLTFNNSSPIIKKTQFNPPKKK